MPKRNFQPGNKRNPFQNYSNKRRAQQDMFDNYRNQQQQLRQGNESPQRTVQHADMDVDRGRVPSPPPPPSPGKENGQSAPSSAQSSGADATGDWPPSLKDYVSRAFASVRNEGDRDMIQDLLKKKLTDAFNSGRTKLIDWDKEPLPHEMLTSSPSIRPGLNFNHKNSRWGPSPGFSLREGNRAGRGRGHFQGRRRSPPGYRRPRSRSRSRSSSPYSRSSRSYSRSRSRSRSPPSRGGRRDRRRNEPHGRKKFRDLGSDSDSDSGSRSSRSPVPRRRSFVERKVEKSARGRGRGAKNNQLNKKKGKG